MANGIDWFRWHHGTVNDPKFQLIARRSSASVAEVVAVWALLLESASAAQERGRVGSQDFEAIDCALGMDDGRAEAIYSQMQARGLISDDGTLSKWSDRQPARERDGDSSAERVRRHRERKRQGGVDVTGVTDVTPSNASNDQETPREEKRREEERRISTPDTSLETENSLGLDTHRASARAQPGVETPPADVAVAGREGRLRACSPPPATVVAALSAGEACKAMREVGMATTSPAHPELQALIRAGATRAEFAHAAAVALDKGKGFQYALGVLKGQLADARASPKARSDPDALHAHNRAVAAAWLADMHSAGETT